MDIRTHYEEQPMNYFPDLSDLRTPPKSVSEGAWIVFVLCIPLSLYFLKEVISITIASIKAKKNMEFLEDKQELAQRQKLIDNLQSQLDYAQKQNNILINELMILRRTMEFSGDFTNYKEKKR